MQYARLWIALLLASLLAGCQMVITPEPAGQTVPPAETSPAEASPAEESVPQPADESIYIDPQGRFTAPVPTNWRAETRDGYAVIASPEDQIQVYLLALPADDVEAAIAQAWEIVEPGFALEIDQVFESPPSGGLEAVVNISYASEDDEQIVTAGGMLYQGVVYALLMRADLTALQQRSAQLGIIQSGFRPSALERRDLTNTEPLPLDDALLAEFEAYIAEAMPRFDVPGASVAVVQNGEIVYAQGFGVTELDGTEPVTPETLMMIGSTGKSMTTMMMATLVDEGLMDWDTPAQEILPQFAVADPELSEQITVRNLVCACTGVPRRDLELFFNIASLDAEGIVESLRTFVFFTDFGEAFQYSNQLVATGGYVAAAAAGAEWGNLFDTYLSEMQQRIFDPIAMTATTFDMDAVEAEGNFATPHGQLADASYAPMSLDLERFVIPIAPAGAPWSNVLDMSRYLITLLNEGVAPDGTRVVSAENLAVTWEPQIAITADAAYGLGWIVDDYRGLPMIQHGGNTLGFTSDLAFLPDAGLGITVLTNARATNLFSEAVRFRLLEMIYQQPHEADALAHFAHQTIREESLRVVANIVVPDPAQVEPFLGRYINEALGEIEMRLDEGQLVMDAGEFVMEVRAQLDDDGQVQNYITYSLPLIGLPLSIEEGTSERPTLIMGAGAVSYRFTPLD